MLNFANGTGNMKGKRTNRGFEGLAISPDGAFIYAMLQSAMLDEGEATVCAIVLLNSAPNPALPWPNMLTRWKAQARGA
ncbi:hypothetical protein W02_16740 [Nitrospira sp. KM1]|nr:hypothetical protein W02_16740 [Nitrospira sp. KM1]